MNLRRIVVIFFLLFVGVDLVAQALKPISWTSALSTPQAKVGDTIELIFRAEINDTWYLYSTDFSPDLGPVVTSFSFKPNSSYKLVGKIQPIGAKKKYDKEIWDGEYTYFVEHAEFRQKIKVLSESFHVEVSNEYQVCSEETGQCVMLNEDFTFQESIVSGENTDSKTPEKSDAENISSAQNSSLENATQSSPTKLSDQVDEQQSLWQFLLVAFGAGLIALLTPCVYPMIPMTVSFFTSHSKTRKEAISKALVYGFSIITIYTLIGLVVSAVFGPEFANIMATHWFPNVLFFIIFIVFALSFFGLFELVIPSQFVNKVDAQADKGGYLGVFFMAFVLVLVSFSCTGPIIGSILVAAANGEFIRPVLGMLACSMAFAIPFTLFAMFPSLMQNLPQSGGWLNAVKVVLGFIELALAFKFLSTADQVYHWGILDRDIYLAIWISIGIMLGLYLLGKVRLPHDSPMEKLSVGRLILAICTFAFVLYMIPGIFGAPLSLLSGLLPPRSTLEFDLTKSTGFASPSHQILGKKAKYADLLHLPHGLTGYFDYDEALQAAKEVGKPLFIDFTGHGCVNCRKMEANVWSHPEVLKRLRNDYVLVALYIDERTELPEKEQYVSKNDGKKKTTLGKKNSDLQITKFGNNAQPFYVILGNKNDTPLVKPKAYDSDVQKFIEFLDAGINAFNKQKSN